VQPIFYGAVGISEDASNGVGGTRVLVLVLVIAVPAVLVATSIVIAVAAVAIAAVAVAAVAIAVAAAGAIDAVVIASGTTDLEHQTKQRRGLGTRWQWYEYW